MPTFTERELELFARESVVRNICWQVAVTEFAVLNSQEFDKLDESIQSTAS